MVSTRFHSFVFFTFLYTGKTFPSQISANVFGLERRGVYKGPSLPRPRRPGILRRVSSVHCCVRRAIRFARRIFDGFRTAPSEHTKSRWGHDTVAIRPYRVVRRHGGARPTWGSIQPIAHRRRVRRRWQKICWRPLCPLIQRSASLSERRSDNHRSRVLETQ